MELLKTKKYWVAACSVLVTLFFMLVLASVIYFAWIMPLLETKLLRIYGVMIWIVLLPRTVLEMDSCLHQLVASVDQTWIEIKQVLR